MKTRISLSVIFSALALLALSVPSHASEMDSRIESSARQSHVFRTYLQGDEIRVHSGNGVVTLTGIVSENFHKSLAQETVSGLPGVTRVDNQLEVKGAAPTPNSDAWLRDRVKVALLFHRKVSGVATGVEVTNGVVTLRGEAASQVQKELSTEYAKDVEGVGDVKNEMIVLYKSSKKARTVGEKIDDASVTAQVNMTLLNHRATSVLNTTVKTKRGVVTVGGKAGNASEKVLVGKLVADISGVKGVKNLMTIE
jgi:hyperosmotically inducible periplasmic protein